MFAGLTPHPVTRYSPQGVLSADDVLAVEVPIALEFNGISHAVMLASPQDLQVFALGFALTEGIISDAAGFYGVEIVPSALGITLQCDIAPRDFVQLKQRRRVLMGRSGCGLCGLDSLAQLAPALSPLAPAAALSATAILHAVRALPAHQPLNQVSGALHAAAWCAVSGEILQVCEDIGRHNALDKLVGKQCRAGFADGFLLMSSRASVELVQKAARVGIPHLVALSAPTSLAVQTAEQVGMTLVGFARDAQFVLYTSATDII